MKRKLIAWLVVLGAGSWQVSGEALHQVTAVRLWPGVEATRVAIEVSGEFDFHSERAHNPERVFFDIFHSRPSIQGRRVYAKIYDNKLVKKVRVAETLIGVTRIVLDLQGPADYTANQLSNPDRLIIEVRPKSTTAPSVAPAPVVTQTLPQPPTIAPAAAATAPAPVT